MFLNIRNENYSMSKYELSPEVLKIICCPTDKQDLKYDKKKKTLTCTYCKCVYPIKNGIPILLPKK